MEPQNHIKNHWPKYALAGGLGLGTSEFLKRKSSDLGKHLDATQGTAIQASPEYNEFGKPIGIKVDRVFDAEPFNPSITSKGLTDSVNQNNADAHEKWMQDTVSALSESEVKTGGFVAPAAGGALAGAGYWASQDPVITSNVGRFANNMKNIWGGDKELGEKANLSKVAFLGARENIASWLPENQGVQIEMKPDNGIVKGAVDKIDSILESFNDWSNSKKAAGVAGVGALGYGLGTGDVQKGAKYLYNTKMSDIGSDAKEASTSAMDSIKDSTLGGAVDKVADTISKITGD